MEITKEIVPLIDFDKAKYKSYDELVDNLEKEIVDNFVNIDLPLVHRITNGIYTREMVAPKGALITSKPHTTNHQFIVSEGVILIYDEFTSKWTEVRAPYHGVTKAGTRRIGLVIEDVVWTTIHSVPEIEDRDYTQEEFIGLIDLIEDRIIDKRKNNLLDI